MDGEGSSGVAPAKPAEGWIGRIESIVVTVSQTSIGQILLKFVDRFLWVVEKSAQWSLPIQDLAAAEENGKSFGATKLVRPLPWILFLPGLFILRAIRGGLNVGAYIVGYPQIQPSGMVKFVQKSRRRLRALNQRGIKNLRRESNTAKDKRVSMIEAKRALIRSIKLTLSTLSCLDTSKALPSPPPTKIHITDMDLETMIREPFAASSLAGSPDEKSTTESTASPMHTEVKRKYSQVSLDDDSEHDESDEEPLQTKIDRLALEDSMEDPDFNPADCSTESTSDSENNDSEHKVSISELNDLWDETKQAFNAADGQASSCPKKESTYAKVVAQPEKTSKTVK